MEPKENHRVEFSAAKSLAVGGLLAGVAIAIGVPAIVLGLGHSLTPQMQLWLTGIGICFGGLTALTTAFFGAVMPSSVASNAYDPDQKKTDKPL